MLTDAIAVVDHHLKAVQLKQLAHLQAVATSADKPELLTRIARLNGVVGWNIAVDVAARLWGQEKTRRALSLRRDALAARAARITTAEVERAAQTGAAAKVEAFRADLGVIETRAKLLTDERARALTERLRERIRKDRDDTRKQLTYAQLAVARLTDQLLTSKRSVP